MTNTDEEHQLTESSIESSVEKCIFCKNSILVKDNYYLECGCKIHQICLKEYLNREFVN